MKIRRHARAAAVLFAAFLTLVPPAALAMRVADAVEWNARTSDPEIKQLLGRLIEIHGKLGEAYGIETRLLVSDSDDVNAFATVYREQRIVVVNAGLIDAFDNDEDAIAAVLAHELGHHAANHVEKGSAVSGALSVLGSIAGAVLDYKFGLGGLASEATDFTADLLSKKFSRDQEREADELGLARMTAAGFSPQGALRMHKRLLEAEGGGASFLSSHPGGEERIARLEALIAQSADAKALADKAQVALAARAPAPPEETIDGISLERYAAIANALAASDNAEATYAKVGIARDKYTAVAEKWNARLKQDRALGKRYSVAYLDASTGRFAVYGKSAARMLRGEKGGDDSPAPLPLADYVRATKLMMAGGVQLAAPLEKLKLTPYEWHIVQSWWSQRLIRDEAARMEFAAAMSAKEPD